jgi:MFS family permease
MQQYMVDNLFRNRSFIFLWAAQLMCQLADRVFTYVLMVVAFEHFHRSHLANLGTSLPMLLYAIPAVLFSAFFGVFVDRWKKKPILFLSNVIRALLVLLIPFIHLHEEVLLIFIIASGVFTVAQIFAPAESSALSGIVSKKNLVSANALFMSTWMGASVFGFGLAVLVIQFLSINRLYETSAVLYILAALSVLFVHIHEPVRHREEHPVYSIVHELKAGLHFIWRNHVVYVVFFMLFAGIAGLAAVSVLAVGYAELLNISGRNFGLLVVFAGLGMAFGTTWLVKIEPLLKKKFFLIESGFVICGISLVGIALARSVHWACFSIFVLGFGNAFIAAPIQAFLQDFVPEQMRGRVFGVQNMIVSLAFTFPPVVAGYLADLFSIPKIFFLMGLFVTVIGLSARLIPDFKKI